jgi:hypothetical protein
MNSTKTFPKTELAPTCRVMGIGSTRAPRAARFRLSAVLTTKARTSIVCSTGSTQTSMFKTFPLRLLLLEKYSAIGAVFSRRARKEVPRAASLYVQILPHFGSRKNIRP